MRFIKNLELGDLSQLTLKKLISFKNNEDYNDLVSNIFDLGL